MIPASKREGASRRSAGGFAGGRWAYHAVCWCLLAAAAHAVTSRAVWAAEPLIPGLRMPTLGGKQFWADELLFHQWRIQRNVRDNHYRLLDGRNFRYASGTFAECRAKLQQIKRQQKLPPMKGKAVIVLHGLFRSRAAMDKLCTYLQQQGGYAVFNVGYPSTQSDVGSHARTLGRIIENLEGIEEINFVAHSMGNIVIRHYLADRTRRRDPRLKRFVMLAPPNHGALAALALAENRAFQWLTGQSGQQLGAEWARLEGHLATPEFEFGIIAGGKGNGKGYNPLLPGDDDGTISVAGTRLAGARDFAVLPLLHTFLVSEATVHQYTLRFFQRGYFISADKRQPVPKE